MPDPITATQWLPEAATPSLEGACATMRPVSIKAGRVAARHHHDFEQFLFVASGGGTLQCEAGFIRLQPGTALHLPPGAWHSAVFDADTLLIELNLNPVA